jgi:hypothetical protein
MDKKLWPQVINDLNCETNHNLTNNYISWIRQLVEEFNLNYNNPVKGYLQKIEDTLKRDALKRIENQKGGKKRGFELELGAGVAAEEERRAAEAAKADEAAKAANEPANTSSAPANAPSSPATNAPSAPSAPANAPSSKANASSAQANASSTKANASSAQASASSAPANASSTKAKSAKSKNEDKLEKELKKEEEAKPNYVLNNNLNILCEKIKDKVYFDNNAIKDADKKYNNALITKKFDASQKFITTFFEKFAEKKIHIQC